MWTVVTIRSSRTPVQKIIDKLKIRQTERRFECFRNVLNAKLLNAFKTIEISIAPYRAIVFSKCIQIRIIEPLETGKMQRAPVEMSTQKSLKFCSFFSLFGEMFKSINETTMQIVTDAPRSIQFWDIHKWFHLFCKNFLVPYWQTPSFFTLWHNTLKNTLKFVF